MNRNTPIIVAVSLALLVILGGGFLWRFHVVTQEMIRQAQEQEAQAAQKGADIQKQAEESRKTQELSVLVDTSNWKTYRNEKYGFEFKLSDEYSVPENVKNQIKTGENVIYLDTKKTSYVFNSREGLKIIGSVFGKGDAADSWVISVSIFGYSKEFDNDFKKWIQRNHDTSVEKFGTSEFPSNVWKNSNFVSWDSICSDYSAFFTDKKSIVEINTCGTSFFYDGKPDYFSAILGTFQYH